MVLSERGWNTLERKGFIFKNLPLSPTPEEWRSIEGRTRLCFRGIGHNRVRRRKGERKISMERIRDLHLFFTIRDLLLLSMMILGFERSASSMVSISHPRNDPRASRRISFRDLRPRLAGNEMDRRVHQMRTIWIETKECNSSDTCQRYRVVGMDTKVLSDVSPS